MLERSPEASELPSSIFYRHIDLELSSISKDGIQPDFAKLESLVEKELNILPGEKRDRPNLFFRCFLRREDGEPLRAGSFVPIIDSNGATTLSMTMKNISDLGIEKNLKSSSDFYAEQGCPYFMYMMPRPNLSIKDTRSFVLVYDVGCTYEDFVPESQIARDFELLSECMASGEFSEGMREEVYKSIKMGTIGTYFRVGLEKSILSGTSPEYLLRYLKKVLTISWK